MKKIGFIADFYQQELPGGGESNDMNLIKHLEINNDITCYKSNEVSTTDLKTLDVILVGNFVLLTEDVKRYLINNKKYIIYEHDHKYVSTRDPSLFLNFNVPDNKIINRDFYEGSYCTVVLSEVCKKVLELNLPNVKVENIGCSLWSEAKFHLLKKLSKTKKNGKTCIMYSDNPTKNYLKAQRYCMLKNINYDSIPKQNHDDFLNTLSNYETLLFLPKVLETFSRLCCEAKMMNVNVMTNRKLIGFYSETSSELTGVELIEDMENKNKKALALFDRLINE